MRQALRKLFFFYNIGKKTRITNKCLPRFLTVTPKKTEFQLYTDDFPSLPRKSQQTPKNTHNKQPDATTHRLMRKRKQRIHTHKHCMRFQDVLIHIL